MKDINGNDLPQPYYDLAVMRWEKKSGVKDASTRLITAFEWGKTPEENEFWHEVFKGNHPTIPQSSLDELMAWRKLKDISPVEDITPKNGQTIYAIDPCRMEGSGENALTVGRQYIYDDSAGFHSFSVIDDMGGPHTFDKRGFSKYFSITPPADTTDWQAKYEDLKSDYGKLMDEYNEEVSKHDELEIRYKDLQCSFSELSEQKIELEKRIENTAKPSNFIAECAMMAMQGLLSDPNYKDVQHTIAGNIVTKPQPKVIAERAFDYAEAMAAEGRKRGHIQPFGNSEQFN